MKYYYSPYTGEHIKTDNPSDWMLSTTKAPAHDGMFFDGTAWYDLQPAPISDLVKSKKLDIDTEAGKTRAKYITVAPGQEATYISKEKQARDYVAAGYPSANVVQYPYVLAEAESIYGLNPTAAQIKTECDNIIAQANAWAVLGATIERVRRTGKIAVSAAADAAAIESAAATAIAELQAL